MKIVINNCFGGFSISEECAKLMAEKGCQVAKAELEEYKKDGSWYGYGYVNGLPGYDRTSNYLIEAVEELGERANNMCSELKVIEIPDDINYYINDYDGMETVEETHRSWS